MHQGLVITTLGDLTFQLGEQTVTGFSSRKAEALLVYLAVERGSTHRRERLFTLLWLGMPESSARNNLRQVLFNIRQALPEVAANGDQDGLVPLLLADRQIVQLNPEAQLELDIHQIDRLLDEVQVHDHLNLAGCEACLGLLEQVVSLYRGEFLSDFYLEDSAEFEEWAGANRQAYRDKVLNTLAKLAEIKVQHGNYAEAKEYAEGQLKIDPLREGAYRQLMELYAKSGRRAQAIRAYQRCMRVLEIELGTRPSRQTTALYEIISGEDRQGEVQPKEGMIRGYQIREHLGSGHMGVVYRAFQPVVNRDVAVKVIAPQYANHPDFIRRFEVEAQLVARLEHPYIVPLYDFWRDPSGAYLVMRWLKGGSLGEHLKNGPWMPDSALALIDQITSALSFAHRQGVVHCDIKPANIMLDEQNTAYLTDFGIATLTGPLAQMNRYSDLGGDGSSSGSLGYLSPELVRGGATTPLADIYSLGVVLFELLTARHPFPGLEGDALIEKHLTAPLPSVRLLRSELPDGVDGVIQRATEKAPSRRYQDVDQLAEAFRQAIYPDILMQPATPEILSEVRNPYKGLRSFEEADSADFFGRDQLVKRLLGRFSPADAITPGERFLAVVGPSGSGKSSVVKAGLIPAVREGAIQGSQDWFVVEMTPGAHPLEELETALLRIAIETPEDFLSQLGSGGSSLLRVLRKALPGVKDDVLLVIDQFEELFTLVEKEAERSHFLGMLAAAVRDPHSTLRLVVTLRADFYDRPLEHGEFGASIQKATEVVLPLNPEELERAISGPAEQVGVQLEPGLVAHIVQEVGDQPGALPLLQYALTESFELREGDQLSLATYESGGGLLGALGRRAEEIYQDLDKTQQEMTRQMFLRLVTLGEGTEDTRRRVLLSEIEAIDGRSQDGFLAVTDPYGRYRLITFDHDPSTRAPTVELAHEALLREWPRLRSWLDESRDDIRMQRLLAAAAREWQANRREASYLLRGSRLEQFDHWVQSSDIALSDDEQAYLDASMTARRERQAAEAERQAHEALLEQRSRRFLWALVGVFAVAALIAGFLSVVAFNQRGVAQENAATATYAQGEALVLADSRATQQVIAEAEAVARATQQTIAEREADARAEAEGLALDERDRAVEAEQEAAAAQQEALKQASVGLASQALAEMQTANSERGVLLALAALEEYPYTPQAEVALARAVQESLPYQQLIDQNGTGLDGHWVDFSPDGQRIALGATENDQGEHAAVVFNTYTSEIDLVIPLEFTEKSNVPMNGRCSVQQIDWSPDGTRLALVANNNNLDTPQPQCYFLQVYDATTGDLLLDLDSQGAFTVDWSPDGQLLLTGGEGGSVKLWDANSGELILDMQGHGKTDFEILPDTSDRVLAARFSADGLYAATFSVGGILHIWETNTGKLTHTFYHPPEVIGAQILYPGMNKIALAWSPDGTRIATAWYDGLGRIWSLDRNQVELILAGHTSNMIGIDWSPNGIYLLTQGIDTSARLWAASTGQMVVNLPTNGFGNTTWSPDSRWMAVPTQQGLLVWDISILPPVINPTTAVKHPVIEALWTPDGNQLVLSGIDGLVIEWSRDKSSWQIAPTTGYIAISPDSNRMVAPQGEDITPPQIIDLQTGEVVKALENPDPEVGYFTNSWSNNGEMVASGTYPGFWTVFWDPETGKELARSDVVEGFMKQAQFSPDDSMLAAPTIFAEGNSPVYLIDTYTGETIRKLPSEDGWSMVAYWSPDKKTLAVGYQSGVIKLWDTKSWSVVKKFEAHLAGIWDLCWSPDGQRIISGDNNSLVLVWEVDTGEVVMTWDMQGLLAGGFNDTKWSPDGQYVVIHGTGDLPYVKRAWQSTEELIDYAYECCVWRELTPEERAQFGLPEKE